MIKYDPSPPKAELAAPVGEPGLRRHVYSDHLRILQGQPERDEKAAAERRQARPHRTPRRRTPPALEDPPATEELLTPESAAESHEETE